MAPDEITLVTPIPERCRADAVRLFWQAFEAKLERVMAPKAKAHYFLSNVMDLRYAIGALDAQGRLVGFAGFKTADGALVGGGMRDLAAVYGWVGALLRGAVLSLFDRPPNKSDLLMDGIAVDARARGQGVGTRLLDAIKAEARSHGRMRIRLDVIDSNPRAKALYERQGFVLGPTTHLGPLRLLFGFKSATTMYFALPDHAPDHEDATNRRDNPARSQGEPQ